MIGTGFGGLAAALRLLRRGYRVTLVEKLDAPGGRAYVYRKDGFVFDGGPTVITAPFMFEDLWRLAGRRMSGEIALRALDPFYRIRFADGHAFHYNADPENMRREVARLCPSDVPGYEAYVKFSREIFEVGFERLAHVPFSNWQSMARIVPAMVRLRSYRTVYGLVSQFVADERVRQVLSFHPLLVGGNPFSTTSIYSLIAHLERRWGVHFPIGGTGALVRGLVGLIEENGGEFLYEAEVSRILLSGRRAVGVRLVDGRELAADVVVSNADAAYTYRQLLPPQVKRRWSPRRIDRARFSMSLFVWYFGTDRKYEEVAHHTILLGPRYRELLDDIFERHRLASDFSLYLHRPTATDPSLAPPGCDGFYVLSPVPHADSGVDWRVKAEPYRRAICRQLERTVLPDLQRHVVTGHLLTPRDFERRLLSVRGAAFSFEPTLSQSAYFRPHNRSEDFSRLYLVGAGTHPGAGVPGVLSSARVLDQVVPDAVALS